MYEIGLILAGIVAGGIVAWAVVSAQGRAGRAVAEELRGQLQGSREEVARLQGELRAAAADKAAAEARLAATQAGLEEQKVLLEDAKGKLTDAFKALAAEALQTTNQDFLRLAETRFETLRQEAEGELEARKTAIETLVRPLQKSLEEYQNEARALEAKRLEAVGAVKQHLEDVVRTQTSLQRETANLVNALRQPQVRGRWGEIALRKTAELAGMTKYCDFVEQESVATEGGRLRPDMIVRLPGNREIVVDSKVALNAYLEATEATTPEARDAALTRHAQQVRSHMRQLATKEYWTQFRQTPELVVLFIAGDPFWAAAAERDPDLQQDALANNILIATPTNFIGLLRTIERVWRQEQIAENAQRISDLGREVHERMATLIEHIARVGKGLKSAIEAYDSAIGSMEKRVLPSVRRFQELGAGSGKDIDPLEPIAQVPRSLVAGDPADPQS